MSVTQEFYVQSLNFIDWGGKKVDFSARLWVGQIIGALMDHFAVRFLFIPDVSMCFISLQSMYPTAVIVLVEINCSLANTTQMSDNIDPGFGTGRPALPEIEYNAPVDVENLAGVAPPNSIEMTGSQESERDGELDLGTCRSQCNSSGRDTTV